MPKIEQGLAWVFQEMDALVFVEQPEDQLLVILDLMVMWLLNFGRMVDGIGILAILGVLFMTLVVLQYIGVAAHAIAIHCIDNKIYNFQSSQINIPFGITQENESKFRQKH